MTLPLHTDVTAPLARALPLLAKGFRPFFLLAAAYAAVVLPVWVLAFRGALSVGTYFPGTYFHAHEMLFGYTLAVIAGFLLTAVSNWTSRETATGPLLVALVALWMAGRAAIFLSPVLPGPVVAAIDLLFVPGLTVACARAIVGARNQRNYQFVAMLTVLFLANLLMHLGALGLDARLMRFGAWLGTWAITAMMLVMTARIVPMFTRNGLGIDSAQNVVWLDRASIGSFLLVAIADLASVDERLVATLAAVTGTLVLARGLPWKPWLTLRQPLSWILHAGHAFIGVGLLLRGASALVPAIGASAALHGLTAGAVGSLTLGMMARVALGHTGRPLSTRPAITMAFVAVVLSALVRVFGPLGGEVAYHHAILLSGVLFALSFLLYLIVYTPILLSPRADGRPG